jgi:CO/xanthine dehydrogenase FAD-binding subunit
MLGHRRADALVIAGGTDAVPNLKHGCTSRSASFTSAACASCISCARTPRASTWARSSRSPSRRGRAIQRDYAGVAKAAGLVASPQIRNMGTLGGNLCLDTRCTYYNQTYFWREALGFCLKKDGVHCTSSAGKRCVAAHSSDVAPMLDRTRRDQMEIAGTGGRRRSRVEEFFVVPPPLDSRRCPQQRAEARRSLVVRGHVAGRVAWGAATAHAAYQTLRSARGRSTFPIAVGGIRGLAGTQWQLARRRG